MAKYIDCDAAIALAKDIIVPTKSGHDYRHRCIDPQDLAELPAADVVERKTGRWFIDGNGTLRCSECKKEALLTLDAIEDVTFCESHFCPNCGAKMEEDQFVDNPPMEYFESGGI